MDAKLNLFAELCTLIGTPASDTTARLWDCLSRYTFHAKAASAGFSASLAAFLSAKRVDGLSEKTLKSYRENLSSAGRFLADKAPAHIGADDIRRYLTYLDTGRGLKRSSIQTHINCLRSFFSWLTQEEQLDRSPMNKIKSHRLDRKHTRKPLTSKELASTRKACSTPRDRALVELLVSTGCRVSELLRVPLCDIDFVHRTFEVLGKGNKTRRVYFSATAASALDAYLASRGPSTLLFPRQNSPALPVGSRTVQRALQRIGERAHLAARLHPHKLRHTFASFAINHGMDAAILQQLLGHENMDTTQIYAKLATKTIARAYQKAVT